MSSSFNRFISRLCTQTAVYWGNPTNNGYGGKTFVDPIEILVRWEDEKELMETMEKSNVTPPNTITARIISVTELQVNGFLYLGTLSDLSSEDLTTPSSIEGAFKINNTRKVPLINGQSIILEYLV